MSAAFIFFALQARGLQPFPPHPEQLYNDMTYLLRPAENERRLQYEALWFARKGRSARDDPCAVFHLGDNPAARACWSIQGKLPSLRKSMGILWHPHSATIILPQERLSFQGWPCFLELSQAALLDPLTLPFVGRDKSRLNQMAGNAFHVAVYGVWAFVCLACLRLD